jgi:hypothetical protein
MRFEKFLPVLFFALSLASPRGWAGTSFKGGDPVALEFQTSAEIAIEEVLSDPADFPQVRGVDLEKILSGTSVLVSNDPLQVTSGDVTQESAAVNSTSPDTIVINRVRWNRISSQEVKNALALHEVLGLAGIEDTGTYVVSAKYLFVRGIQCTPDECAMLPVDVGTFSFEKARVAFGAGQKPSQASLRGLWLEIGVAEFPFSGSPQLAEFSDGGFLQCNGGSNVFLSFENLTDPFGKSSFTVTYSRIESNPTANLIPGETNSVTFTSTGARFVLNGAERPVATGSNSDRGYFDLSCRMMMQDRLLCGGIYSMNYNGVEPGHVVRYLLFSRDFTPLPGSAEDARPLPEFDSRSF